MNDPYFIPDHDGTEPEKAVLYKYYIGDDLVAGFIDDKEHMTWHDFRYNACGSTLLDINGTFEGGDLDGVLQSYKDLGPEYELTVKEFRLPAGTKVREIIGTHEQEIANAIVRIWDSAYYWITAHNEDEDFYASMILKARDLWDAFNGR